MIIRILSSALDDLDRGRRFYGFHGADLGRDFIETLFSEIDSLAESGGIHRKVFGFHRMLSKRFPYAVYYRVEADGIVMVWRVLDLRQAPDAIRSRLG